MNIQAEVSFYPLRTMELGSAINGFLSALESSDLDITPGPMSTCVQGDHERVFAGLARAFGACSGGEQAVLVVKASNACPTKYEN